MPFGYVIVVPAYSILRHFRSINNAETQILLV
jgi:hypothetical protein